MNTLRLRWATSFFLAALLLTVSPDRGEAKSYSSGGGRSYSSSSSRSSGSSSPRSSSGGGSRSSSGGSSSSSRSFSSSKGKSYSSGSTSSDENRHSYSASKSYSSSSGHTFSSGGKTRTEARSKEPASHSGSTSRQDARSTTSASDFAFDRDAARARKEEASRQEFARFKDASKPPGSDIPRPPLATPSPSSGGGSYRRPVYIPDAETIWTRPARARTIFYPYVERPVVVYRDPYSSFFWWWLLDRTLDDRAAWAYHHRYDMDPARYQALVSENHDLEQRVAQLETNQVPRDPSYTPAGIDRDLMYSDKQVARVYHNRPTTSGSVMFWLVAIPLAAGAGYFLVWLVFFKRWQAPRRAAAAT